MTREFLAFLVTSGIAAIANVLARLVFSQFIAYEIAVVLAYLIGMFVAYMLARKYVFEASGQKVSREVSGFILINLIALAQVWLVSVGLYRFILPAINWTLHPDLIAHLIGVASPAFTSFFGHKYISFRKKDG